MHSCFKFGFVCISWYVFLQDKQKRLGFFDKERSTLVRQKYSSQVKPISSLLKTSSEYSTPPQNLYNIIHAHTDMAREGPHSKWEMDKQCCRGPEAGMGCILTWKDNVQWTNDTQQSQPVPC